MWNKMIIAICGKKRTGKDTIATMLINDYAFTSCKFAQQLKNGICSFFNFSHSQLEGPEKDDVDPRWGISPRQAMQWMGTDVMQWGINTLLPDIGRNFWAKQLAIQINEKNDNSQVVISDMRFFHEYQYFKEMFGDRFITVRVHRDIAEGATADLHASEMDCDNIPEDFTIYNTGSLESLNEKVRELMSAVSGRRRSTTSATTPVLSRDHERCDGKEAFDDIGNNAGSLERS